MISSVVPAQSLPKDGVENISNCPELDRPTGRLHRFDVHEVGSTGCNVISGPLYRAPL